jgi:hypothetical protein
LAKISKLKLKGKSGEEYAFSVYPLDQGFKAVGAVYAVTRRHKNKKGEYSHDVIYVGETRNLSERFEDHHKIDCFKEHDANCICVHRDDDSDSRLAKEDDLVKQHNPDCNG